MSDDASAGNAHVTVLLRHDREVLLIRPGDAAGSAADPWRGIVARPADDPAAAARDAIDGATDLDPTADVTLVRRGDPVRCAGRNGGARRVVHPFLFEVGTRTRRVALTTDPVDHAWVPPPAIRRRETVPDLWPSYERVRPTVDAVIEDREHGSTTLSLRALAVLRDEAAIAAERDADGRDDLAATARTLRDARPSMPVIANRVNRAMAAAVERVTPEAPERVTPEAPERVTPEAPERVTPRAVERAAADGIDRALVADDEAAAHAAERIPERVATLSRSGTVAAALAGADPAFVLVAESRPGREGIDTAEGVAAGTDAAVTVTTDAAFAGLVADRDVGAVLVGADAVLPDGTVINKAGTHGAAAVAAAAGADCYVVAASDKIRPRKTAAGTDGPGGGDAAFDPEARDPADVYSGDADADVDVANPTFEATPGALIDAIITESGPIDADDVREIAAAHRRNATWDQA